MVFSIFSSIIKKKEKEDYVEIPETQKEKKFEVRIEKINSVVDVERVLSYVKKGNILIVKLKDLQKQDLGEFQTAIQRMKRICNQNGWKIAGIEEGYLILGPKFTDILK